MREIVICVEQSVFLVESFIYERVNPTAPHEDERDNPRHYHCKPRGPQLLT